VPELMQAGNLEEREIIEGRNRRGKEACSPQAKP